MSRFYEGDGFDDEEDERAYYKRLDEAWASAKPDLTGFLTHLDTMPVKRIIRSRFIAPASGQACAVGEYCKYKDIDRKELLRTEAESRVQRMGDEGSEECEGWDGPTVGMGVRAGLPDYVAHDLGWHNDNTWDRVDTGVIETERGGKTHVYRDMTPEERWLRLRNYIALRVGAARI